MQPARQSPVTNPRYARPLPETAANKKLTKAF